MRLVNKGCRHARYFRGFEYVVPRGEEREIPDAIAYKIMKRFPSVEIVKEPPIKRKGIIVKDPEQVAPVEVKPTEPAFAFITPIQEGETI